MASSRPTPGERAYRANLSDVFLLLAATLWFAGFCVIVETGSWTFTISIWVIALYLFVASLVQWARRG